MGGGKWEVRGEKWEVGSGKSDNMSGYGIAWYQALELLSYCRVRRSKPGKLLCSFCLQEGTANESHN